MRNFKINKLKQRLMIAAAFLLVGATLDSAPDFTAPAEDLAKHRLHLLRQVHPEVYCHPWIKRVLGLGDPMICPSQRKYTAGL